MAPVELVPGAGGQPLLGDLAPPPTTTISTVFAETVRHHTNQVAVVDASGSAFTYGALASLAARIEGSLRRRGIGRGEMVGLAMRRSVDRIAVQLATVALGAVYVPVDAISWPVVRIEELAQLCGARLFVTDRAIGDRLAGLTSVEVVDVDVLVAGLGTPGGDADIRPADFAYVNFTSGSTGTPKAVPAPQHAVVNLVRDPTYATLAPSSVVLHLAPITFDAATFEVWGPLLNGGTCVLFPDSLFTCSSFARVVERFRVDTIFLTTAVFNTVLDEMPTALDDVGQVLTGGEAHSTTHMRRAADRYGPGRVISVYGPTEATTFATYHPVTEVPEGWNDVPLGRPIQKTAAIVVRDGRVSPVGEVGELWLTGAGLAAGYLNPAADARGAFDCARIGDRSFLVYKTGDASTVDESGRLRFRGRIDEQVKRRGYRIEPGEIADHVNHHPEVTSSGVVCTTGPLSQPVITAFAVVRSPATSAEEIQSFLRGRLPDYLIPDRVMIIDAMPINSVGKIDKQQLRTRAEAPGHDH
jgi:amino acid adenylation domain-containing protein